MFKIEFYVEDKNLGEAFKRLSGIAMNVGHAYVPNLEKKANGKVHQTAADTLEMLSKEIHKLGKPTIMGTEIREIISKVGMNPTSYSHFIGSLANAGLLKRGKKVGTAVQYIVTGK